MKRPSVPLMIIASLGAMALHLWNYSPPTDEELRARNDKRRRDKEISDKRIAQTRAELRRHGDRWKLYDEPEIKSEWHRRAYDRFEPATAGKSVHEEITGRRGFRGPERVRLTDHSTGDQLEILGGDVADNWFTGAVRAGSDGTPQRFEFSRGVDDLTGHQLVQVGKEVDDAGMQALSRLFNSNSRKLPLGQQRPVVLRRLKERYRGADGSDLLRRETEDFLDGYVDELYASRRMDPGTGKKKPRGWEYL